jgi:predicted nucleic acid-binding protein
MSEKITPGPEETIEYIDADAEDLSEILSFDEDDDGLTR